MSQDIAEILKEIWHGGNARALGRRTNGASQAADDA
jgi:hypothetical protein